MTEIVLVALGAALVLLAGWVGRGPGRVEKSMESAEEDALEERLHDEVDRKHDALGRLPREQRYRDAVERLRRYLRRGTGGGGE